MSGMNLRVNETMVSTVCDELKYLPGCATAEGVKVFSKPNYDKYNDEKAQKCADCLVRLECLTDGVNEILSSGVVPRHDRVGEFRAGFGPRHLAELVQTFRDENVTHVTIDDVENIPVPTRS